VIEKVQKQTFITDLFQEKVMKDPEDIQRLIRLKKYETPGEEYFQTFLEDFKDRQRGEMLKQSARGLLLERVTMWFDEINGPRWFAPVGATAAAAIAFGIYTARPANSDKGTAVQGIASITENSLPAMPPAKSTPIEVEEVITLQLPNRTPRVPGLGSSPSETQGIVPASARATFREL
jgi:hypothetical protein